MSKSRHRCAGHKGVGAHKSLCLTDTVVARVNGLRQRNQARENLVTNSSRNGNRSIFTTEAPFDCAQGRLWTRRSARKSSMEARGRWPKGQLYLIVEFFRNL